MTLLTLGVLIWIAAHVFKSAFPDARGSLDAALGAGPAKGAVAAVLAVALVLMILGYQRAPYVALYTPPGWGVHVNNLAMLAAVALLGMGKSRGTARAWLRHPMLVGVAVWGLAHLLVNGHLAALILFGGLAAWALAHMQLINAREGAWIRATPGPVSGDVRLAVIALVVYAGIAGVHAWLGVWPFPG